MSTENQVSKSEEGTAPVLSALELEVNAVDLNTVVKTLITLIDEVKLNLSNKGIIIMAVDPAHVAMVKIDLAPDFFEVYGVQEVDHIGVDVERLSSLLKMAKKTKKDPDILRFEYLPEKNKLAYSVGYNDGKIPLVDTSGMSDPKIPNLNLVAEYMVKVSDIVTFIKRAECVSDHIMIEVMADKVTFSAEGETDSARMTLPKGSEALPELQGEPCRSLFSLEYFSNLVKAMKGATEYITMHIGNNYPMKVEYEIAEGTGKVLYLLAPRLENA